MAVIAVIFSGCVDTKSPLVTTDLNDLRGDLGHLPERGFAFYNCPITLRPTSVIAV